MSTYLGQPPFGQTVRTTTSVVATAGQTTVYPTGGYTIGYIDVWVNGAKLTENTDFTANDGLSVVFSPALDLNDQVEVVAYGTFSLVDAVKRSGDTMSGALNVQNLIPTSNVTYSLGNNTLRFNDLYLANNSIYLGEIILGANDTNLLISNSSGLIGAAAYGGGVNGYSYSTANQTLTIFTTNGTSYSATVTTGNSSTVGLLQIVDSTSNTSATVAASANAAKVAYDTAVTAQNMAANAYSNAASYADTKAATAFSNAATYADTKAATAYSNATSYADTKAATAYSNATSYADTKAAAAYANAIAYSGNAALAYANAIAYAASNTYVNTTFAPLAGATFTGPVSGITTLAAGNTTITGYANISGTLNVGGVATISGNLIVNGTTITVNTSQINVTDSLLYLASNNEVSDSLDIGFAAHYNAGSGANGHTGFVRSAVDKKYYLFQNYQPEFFANNNVDFANTSTGIQMADLVVGNLVANSTLSVTGATTLSSTLATGNTTITGFANVSSTLRVAGATTLVSTLAAGNTTITGFANVSTYLQVGTTISGGNTTITGFVNVSTSVAAANINTSGTVSADIITVSNVTQTQTNLQVDPAGTAFLNALIYG